jgi:hypothetical protein
MVLAALPAILGSTMLVAAGLAFPSFLPLAITVALLSTSLVAVTSQARVDVGEDGVLVAPLVGKSRFVPFDRIARVDEHEGLRLRLMLVDGTHFDVETRRDENISKERYVARCDALRDLVRERVAAVSRREPDEIDAERVLAEALAAHDRDAEGSYRVRVAMPDDDVRRVLADPVAPFEARAAAAVVLRRRLGDAAKDDLRAAAEATAEEELRTLFRAASDVPEAELETELRGAVERRQTG